MVLSASSGSLSAVLAVQTINAARICQVTVGVKAVLAGGISVDRTAGDRHREVVVRQVGICRIQAVVRRR